MTYEYKCEKCNETWEMNVPMDDRDKPCEDLCVTCGGKIVRLVSSPGISYNGAMSPIRRAGSGWNDVLKGIKKASGSGCTINHY
jgi:putative FmdB family regulatory protein